MSTEIRVATIYLENLAARIRDVTADLRRHSDLGGHGLPCTPDVERAFRSLEQRWDWHRSRLGESLDAIADGFVVTAQSFREVDDELAAMLDTGEGS